MAKEVRDVDSINERFAELSALIFPEGMRLYYAAVDELIEQDVNPQGMSQQMFDQLTANIKSAGTLESTPLCVRTERGVEIISGHHRKRAAKEAGVQHILVFLYDKLPEDWKLSKQLAHNTIAGEADPQLVERVWARIKDVQAQFEAFVDPRKFRDPPARVGFTQVDVDLDALAKTVIDHLSLVAGR